MSKVVPYVPPGDYELPAMAGKQDAFIVVSSLAFVILFAERGLYAYLDSAQRSVRTGAVIIGLASILVFAGMLASFYLPPRLKPEHDQSRWIPHTLDFLMGQAVIAVICVSAAFVVATGLFIYMVYPDLLAVSWLIRDGFMYLAIGAIIYQGYVLFVRYLGFLYQTGGADKQKVIAFQAGGAVFLVIFGVCQYLIDLSQVLGATPEQGLLALHLTLRDVWLAVMLLLVFAWQFARAGDH